MFTNNTKINEIVYGLKLLDIFDNYVIISPMSETDKSYCIQGTVTQHWIKCKEMPFFVNNNGDIAYREANNVMLEITGKCDTTTKAVLKSLNQAYKLGYEMD